MSGKQTTFLAATMWLLAHLVAVAQSQTIPRNGYLETVWTEDNGLPENSVRHLIMGADGYLWGATYEGVVRFDGIKFQIFDKSNIANLKTNLIYSICEDTQGNLWIGSNGGGATVRRRDGSSVLFSESKGEIASDVVRWVAPHKDGSVWLASEKGVNYFENSKMYRLDAFPSDATTNAIFVDSKGNVWVSSPDKGVFLFANKKLVRFFPQGEGGLMPGTTMMFAEDRNGNIWMACRGGLVRYDGTGISTFTNTGNKLVSDFFHSIYYDERENVMWVGTMGAEIAMIDLQGNIRLHFAKDESLDSSVNTILKDNEGNIWYGVYKGGLRRLQKPKFTAYSTLNGLADDIAKVVCEGANGTMYIGTNNQGISVFNQGSFSNISSVSGLTKDNINALWYDRRGNLWVGTYHGHLNRISPQGKISVYDDKAGLTGDFISSIFEDSAGKLWIGSYGNGLYFMDNERIYPYITTQGDSSLAKGIIRCLHEDRQKRLWVGTNDGLFCIEKGTIKRYTTEDGLSYNMVVSIWEDNKTDCLLFGTRGGGITALRNGKFRKCTAENGLFNDVVYAILEDAKGTLWMSCNKGIFTVSRKDLLTFIDGRVDKISCKAYGKADGMLSLQCNGGFSPAAWKARDGRLWFPTSKGVVVVDPSNLQINTRPPSIHIESVAFDNKSVSNFSRDTTLIFDSRIDRLQFNFTAISLTGNEKVKFRYKLEGFDADWKDNNGNRFVYYTNLPYGDYTFRVTASNNDGVWNEEGTFIKISIPAPFWYQWWFYVIAFTAVSIVIAVYIRTREANLRRSKEKLEQLVQEKTEEIRREKEIVEKQNNALTVSNEQIAAQKGIIEQANVKITDSIRYAKRIQDAMLPSRETVQKAFPQSFVLYIPRDIVSGDFFWVKEKGSHFKIAVADCTGHGVPGAFMTLIGYNMLEEITQNPTVVKTPEQILTELDERVVSSLSKHDTDLHDGMDMCLISYDTSSGTVSFAGAKNPLYMVRQGHLEVIPASKVPIGSSQFKRKKIFEQHQFEVRSGDTLYLCTDGFQDQFGGPENRKFMVSNLRRLLAETATLPIDEQEAHLLMAITEWTGNCPQTDDILIIGIHF